MCYRKDWPCLKFRGSFHAAKWANLCKQWVVKCCCDIPILVKKWFSKYEEMISNYSKSFVRQQVAGNHFQQKECLLFLRNFGNDWHKNDYQRFGNYHFLWQKKHFHLEMIFVKWFTATKNHFLLFFAEKKWFTAVKNHLLPVQKWLTTQENDFEGTQK